MDTAFALYSHAKGSGANSADSTHFFLGGHQGEFKSATTCRDGEVRMFHTSREQGQHNEFITIPNLDLQIMGLHKIA